MSESRVSRREDLVGLASLAVAVAAVVALEADVYPRVALVIVVAMLALNAVLLVRSLR